MGDIRLLLVAAALVAVQTGPEPERGLRDEQCGLAPILIADHDGVQFRASCDRSGDRVTFRLKISMPDPHGVLRSLSLEFCGTPVKRAAGPAHWTVDVEPHQDRTIVSWDRPDDDRPLDMSREDAGAEFTVSLSPGWALGWASDVWWESGGEPRISSQFTTHAC